MWCADNWRDYELLDTSDGERTERWGDYILIRHDPQVIGAGVPPRPLWKKANGIYRRSSTGGGSWVKNTMPAEWHIGYGDRLRFVLRPMGFKHTGLSRSRRRTGIGFPCSSAVRGRRSRSGRCAC